MSAVIVPGDRVFYGVDPRSRGFPLVERDVGTVERVYATVHGTYAQVRFGPGRKPLRFPIWEFSKAVNLPRREVTK